MKLECARLVSSLNASEGDIRHAFADDRGRGEFIMLSQTDQVFIQASGEGDGPYTLEYREDDENHHYQCVDSVNKPQLESAFVKYLKGDTTWKTAFQWRKLEKKPWWKFW